MFNPAICKLLFCFLILSFLLVLIICPSLGFIFSGKEVVPLLFLFLCSTLKASLARYKIVRNFKLLLHCFFLVPHVCDILTPVWFFFLCGHPIFSTKKLSGFLLGDFTVMCLKMCHFSSRNFSNNSLNTPFCASLSKLQIDRCWNIWIYTPCRLTFPPNFSPPDPLFSLHSGRYPWLYLLLVNLFLSYAHSNMQSQTIY